MTTYTVTIDSRSSGWAKMKLIEFTDIVLTNLSTVASQAMRAARDVWERYRLDERRLEEIRSRARGRAAIARFLHDVRESTAQRWAFGESLRLGRVPLDHPSMVTHRRPVANLELRFPVARKPTARFGVRGYSHVRAWKRRARS